MTLERFEKHCNDNDISKNSLNDPTVCVWRIGYVTKAKDVRTIAYIQSTYRDAIYRAVGDDEFWKYRDGFILPLVIENFSAKT